MKLHIEAPPTVVGEDRKKEKKNFMFCTSVIKSFGQTCKYQMLLKTMQILIHSKLDGKYL